MPRLSVLVRSALHMLFIASVSAVSLLTLAALAGFAGPISILRSSSSTTFIPGHQDSDVHRSPELARFALQKILDDASQVFGVYEDAQVDASEWMKAYADDTEIVHMNIPGAHDAATWNYSLETRSSLDHVTNLVHGIEYPPEFFRCQDKSIIDMLNAGIRVFDLRYAFDVTKTTLVFWHGQALQSQTATVDDVLFGFYQWLDDHSSEAVLLSFQYEGNIPMNNIDGADVQNALYKTLTSPAAKKYINQNKNSFGTLGEARGKITLIRRFDFDMLPLSYESTIPGVHFSPTKWTNNGDNITLVFNPSLDEKGTAYIQDYYQPQTPLGSTAEENIRWKLNATVAHLQYASETKANSLFWSFASSTNILNTPPNTPAVQALGNGTQLTPLGGVNQQLMPVLENLKGKRLGILMLDFFEQPEGLVPLFLSLLSPEEARGYGRRA